MRKDQTRAMKKEQTRESNEKGAMKKEQTRAMKKKGMKHDQMSNEKGIDTNIEKGAMQKEQ